MNRTSHKPGAALMTAQSSQVERQRRQVMAITAPARRNFAHQHAKIGGQNAPGFRPLAGATKPEKVASVATLAGQKSRFLMART
jgi:hypothetical protein